MEIKGKIIKKLPLQSGEGRNGNWQRQEYVLEYGDRYPKQMCFSLRGDKIEQYPLEIDQEVIVSFDVESREYNGRYYTNVNAWRIDKADAQGATAPAAAPAGQPQTAFGQMAAPADFNTADDKDDLPF
ncbi:MAG: DUF3127 domain-containing protein [Bacteroidales bacterium]|nr:DUF3127 domain-containing protein [Bacteroidales bacterium]